MSFTSRHLNRPVTDSTLAARADELRETAEELIRRADELEARMTIRNISA